MTDLKIASLLKWLIRGKTMTRAMLNIRVSSLAPLNGVTIDLGGGGIPSYKELIKVNGTFINMDAIAEARPTIVGDLESTHPFMNEYADSIILFNTLEHVYGYQHVISEMFRVLKNGGNALVYVPFIFPVHMHQTENFLINDYFRYTEGALKKIFDTAGFSSVVVIPQGGLFIVVAEFLGFVAKFRFLRLVISASCLLLEKIYRYVHPGISAERYPLAYFIIATK